MSENFGESLQDIDPNLLEQVFLGILDKKDSPAEQLSMQEQATEQFPQIVELAELIKDFGEEQGMSAEETYGMNVGVNLFVTALGQYAVVSSLRDKFPDMPEDPSA